MATRRPARRTVRRRNPRVHGAAEIRKAMGAAYKNLTEAMRVFTFVGYTDMTEADARMAAAVMDEVETAQKHILKGLNKLGD